MYTSFLKKALRVTLSRTSEGQTSSSCFFVLSDAPSFHAFLRYTTHLIMKRRQYLAFAPTRSRLRVHHCLVRQFAFVTCEVRDSNRILTGLKLFTLYKHVDANQKLYLVDTNVEQGRNSIFDISLQHTRQQDTLSHK